MKLLERRIEIASGELTLEGALHEDTGSFAAVVLHPHPMLGGDMDNHVVTAACQTLAEAGGTTLRFNFRGAGRSQGSYDGGTGEADDARAAVETMRALRPGAALALVGYSFGAAIAANIAGDIAPDALALISPPVAMMKLPALNEQLPALLITGDLDQVAPPAALKDRASSSHRVVGVPGVDHSWWPGLNVLGVELTAFVNSTGLTSR
jgi:alpha/beta superfamily hydrolase